MNRFFDIIVQNPVLVDHYAGSQNYDGPPFTEMFSHLFPQSTIYSESVKSYLTIVSNNFPLNPAVRIHPRTMDSVKNLFWSVGLDPEDPENAPTCIFWAYLTKMYWIHHRKYRGDDQIFAFMNDFGLNEIKVVILANNPAPECLSSGRAFHLSQCSSTRWLLDFLQYEMNLMENVRRFRCQNNTRLTLDEAELGIAKGHCNLQGWINQRILLINTFLTPESDKWRVFTDFLISHLSRTRTNLVFMLLGNPASKKQDLIDQTRHLVLCVRHPSSYSYPQNSGRVGLQQSDWEVALPLINTNFFLYQSTPNNLIDWTDVTGNKQAGSVQRLTEVFNFCRDLYNIPNAIPYRDNNGYPVYELEHHQSGKMVIKDQSIYR